MIFVVEKPLQSDNADQYQLGNAPSDENLSQKNVDSVEGMEYRG